MCLVALDAAMDSPALREVACAVVEEPAKFGCLGSRDGGLVVRKGHTAGRKRKSGTRAAGTTICTRGTRGRPQGRARGRTLGARGGKMIPGTTRKTLRLGPGSCPPQMCVIHLLITHIPSSTRIVYNG